LRCSATKLLTSWFFNYSLSTHNLKAFIPTHRIRLGIVRDIPQDFAVDQLKDSISSLYLVLEIHRLNCRIKVEGEFKYVPLHTICIKFANQSLPQYINIFNCRYSILPYIPKVRIYFACFHIGLSKACKSQPRCVI